MGVFTWMLKYLWGIHLNVKIPMCVCSLFTAWYVANWSALCPFLGSCVCVCVRLVIVSSGLEQCSKGLIGRGVCTWVWCWVIWKSIFMSVLGCGSLGAQGEQCSLCLIRCKRQYVYTGRCLLMVVSVFRAILCVGLCYIMCTGWAVFSGSNWARCIHGRSLLFLESIFKSMLCVGTNFVGGMNSVHWY